MTRENAEKAADLIRLLELYEKKVPEKLRDLYDKGMHDEVFNMDFELAQKIAQAHSSQLAAL